MLQLQVDKGGEVNMNLLCDLCVLGGEFVRFLINSFTFLSCSFRTVYSHSHHPGAVLK